MGACRLPSSQLRFPVSPVSLKLTLFLLCMVQEGFGGPSSHALKGSFGILRVEESPWKPCLLGFGMSGVSRLDPTILAWKSSEPRRRMCFQDTLPPFSHGTRRAVLVWTLVLLKGPGPERQVPLGGYPLQNQGWNTVLCDPNGPIISRCFDPVGRAQTVQAVQSTVCLPKRALLGVLSVLRRQRNKKEVIHLSGPRVF